MRKYHENPSKNQQLDAITNTKKAMARRACVTAKASIGPRCNPEWNNIIRKSVEWRAVDRAAGRSVWHPWNNRPDRENVGLLLLMSTGYFFEWLWFAHSSAPRGPPTRPRMCTHTRACAVRVPLFDLRAWNARAHHPPLLHAHRSRLVSLEGREAHLRTDWDSSASVPPRCVFLFKCVTTYEILIAGRSQPVSGSHSSFHSNSTT